MLNNRVTRVALAKPNDQSLSLPPLSGSFSPGTDVESSYSRVHVSMRNEGAVIPYGLRAFLWQMFSYHQFILSDKSLMWICDIRAINRILTW